MWLTRILFFRLNESPRYLVHAGRPHEAVRSLQLISKFNGSELLIELADVRDHQPEHGNHIRRVSTATSFDTSVIDDPPFLLSNTQNIGSDGPESLTTYDLTGKSSGSSVLATVPEIMKDDNQLADAILEQPLLSNQREGRSGRRRGLSTTSFRQFSGHEDSVCRILPRWLSVPFINWRSRVAMVLSPEWLRTTVLVWSTWCTTALGVVLLVHLHFLALRISSVYHLQCLPSKITRNATEQRNAVAGDQFVGNCVIHARRVSGCFCLSSYHHLLHFELSSALNRSAPISPNLVLVENGR